MRDITWKPKWVIDIGNDCQMGIGVDDRRFVVLVKNCLDSWAPSEWIHPKVAKRLGELAVSESIL